MFKIGGLSVQEYAGGILPEKLDVGHLIVRETDKRLIPSRFEVSGKLGLVFRSARFVPDTLVVGGELDIASCTVKNWAGDIDCGGLIASVYYPLSFKGKVRVRGDLYAGGADITWPRELRVTGDAFMQKQRIAALPRRMFVSGSLFLEECEIGRMPVYLEVGGDLCLTDATFDTIEGIRRVGGVLQIEGTNIRQLPPQLAKLGGLMAAMSALESLPDDFTTKGNLILIGTPMTSLPKGLRVGGNLFTQNSGIEILPEDAWVAGKIVGVDRPEHLRQAPTSDGRRPYRSLSR